MQQSVRRGRNTGAAAMPEPADASVAPQAGPRATRERGLDRAVALLDALHAAGRPLSAGELATATGSPRSTTYSLVRALDGLGLIELAADGRVHFGQKLYLWGMDYIRANPVVRRGREMVDALARETGETAELCMLQGGRYTIVHMQPGTRPFRISSAIGLTIPLPWTASGRLLLSDMSREAIDRLIADADLKLPDGRVIEREVFVAEIAAARAAGHAVTAGLVDAFTRCLAVPVLDAAGSVAATLCFVVPVDTAEGRIAELLCTLKQAAATVSPTHRGGGLAP